jgi:hypothetical protein
MTECILHEVAYWLSRTHTHRHTRTSASVKKKEKGKRRRRRTHRKDTFFGPLSSARIGFIEVDLHGRD